jgi:hypothetical protein
MRSHVNGSYSGDRSSEFGSEKVKMKTKRNVKRIVSNKRRKRDLETFADSQESYFVMTPDTKEESQFKRKKHIKFLEDADNIKSNDNSHQNKRRRKERRREIK